jgi:chloramphenicol-sensitive protein RarD
MESALPMNRLPTDRSPHAAALANAMGAYLIWGVVGMYFRHVTVHHGVAPFTLLAHRVVWSLCFVACVLAIRHELPAMVAAFKSKRVLLGLFATSLLIAVNWIVFIHASATGQLVPASLGYFLSPIMNVVLGVVILRETLKRAQAVAIGFAVVGVSMMVWLKAGVVWIPLALTFSWSFYAFLRKRIAVGPIAGLGVETAMLLPAALAYVGWMQFNSLESITGTAYAYLIAAGVITAIPLMMFAYAARRLRMVTLGILQYVGPTMQFLLAWFVAGEQVRPLELVSFGLIWVGLVIFTTDGVLAYRRAARVADTPTTPAAVESNV